MTARRCLTLLLSALLLAPASAQADFAETPIYDFKGERDANRRRVAAASDGEFLQDFGMPIRTLAPGRATLTSTLRSLSLRPGTLS